MKDFDEQEYLALCQDVRGGTLYPVTNDMNMAELVVLIEKSGQRIAQAPIPHIMKSISIEFMSRTTLAICMRCPGGRAA